MLDYVYIQLKPQRREIRLLTLLPDTPDQIPRCQLSIQTLDDVPAYNALSYVWGQPASSQAPENVIELNGHRFAVTANLLSALRHLRPPPTAQPVTLWVDAVCINQADLDERSQQVTMMREIYASAERVFIWLGEDDDSSVGVFEMIQEVATISESDGSGNDEKKERRLHLMRKCSDFFFGLANSRPWFSRVWILQELAMAQQDPLVVCGWRSVSWSVLMSVWKAIAREVFSEIGMVRFLDRPGDSNSAQQDEPTVLGNIKIDVFDDLLQARRSHGGASLRELLLFSRTSQATDPRDRIYALLGLLAPPETAEPSSIPIPVDYRKPTWEVYSDAMSHIFSRGQGPYFLSSMFLHGGQAIAPCVPWATPTSLESDSLPSYLPSWVPDFTRQTAETTTKPAGVAFHPPAHNSASGAGTECLNGYRLLDKRVLKVEGLIVDTVHEVISMGDSLAQSIQLFPRLESVTQTARHRQPCFQNLKTNVNALIDQFKSKEPLWRTLICNKHYLSGYEEAPASYEDMYLKLLRDGKAGSDDVTGDRNEYERSLEKHVGRRVFLTTKSGFVGTCVPDGRAGDVIAIWFGSPVPFVLRATSDNIGTTSSDGQTYSLVGAAYVAGIMDGEMVDELYCEDLMDSTTFYVQ
ncbi:HET-domain-containing protein [Cladorrhinum sp. PSN259]|nr:HET-domain-containing protein [Cladorrhinum sp. PSN259]